MPDANQSIPSYVRWTVGGLSALLLVSAIGGAIAGQVVPPKAAWALMGFETVIAFSSIFGLLVCANRVHQAPALAIVCVAGAAMVGTVLGYLAVNRELSFAHLPLKAWLAARVGTSLMLVACAVIAALGSHRQAWRALVRAMCFAAPLVGIAIWYRLSRFAPLNTPMPGFKDSIRLAAIAAVATVCAVCVCAVVHLSIRAFAIADEERPGA